MKERLKALCRDEGVPYGLVVERFETGGGGRGGRFGRGQFGGGRRGAGGDPAERSDLPDCLTFRRIYLDGHEEVVRGGRIVGVTARTLRNVVAAGTDRNVMTRRLTGSGPAAVTLVVPSVLVSGLDVRPAEGNGEKPPLISQPTSLASRG